MEKIRYVILPAGMLFLASFLASAFADWKDDWEKTLAAAQKEGEVMIYGPPGNQYRDAIMTFEVAHPKVKMNYIPGSGTNNSQRLMTERRAEKYLADIFIAGSGTMALLAKGRVLDSLPPILLLPENTDQSLWYGSKHVYADPENQYVFMMQGDVSSSIAAYNTKSVNPAEIKSYWDILNPKWKGKIVAYDPKARGHVQTIRGIYHNPKLGGEFFRRLFSEMDVTLSRDQRLMLDWVAQGKFQLFLFATSNDVDDAQKKGLPVGVIYAPPGEGHMSGGFGHLALVDKAPHPNASKLFANWMLSREGQIQWQKKTDNSSLRMDIPKDILSNPRAVPKQGEKYIISSLPQYEDVKPILKIVDEATAAAGKK